MRSTRGAGVAIDADGLIRRQNFTTLGIVALAVFVSLGMAEWSKRTAASETVMEAAVLEQALPSAAKGPERDKSR